MYNGCEQGERPIEGERRALVERHLFVQLHRLLGMSYPYITHAAAFMNLKMKCDLVFRHGIAL